ncbi:MAG: LysM peptidoglycan-binding domain-containing protein [Peptococcaceae bacterium]
MLKRQQSPPCASGVYWEVAEGDTLYKIAQAAQVGLQELLEANPDIEPDNLTIGQSICIPPGGNVPGPNQVPNCPGGLYWEIAPGDTLFKISQEANVTIAQLLAVNPGINPDNLQVGQIICLPG